MNKKKIIIIVLIVILLVVAGIIISNIFNKNEEEKNNNTNTANLEVPNVEIDKNQVDYDEDATVNELKDFTGASGDSDLYEVATEYDGRKVLKIKDNKQYDSLVQKVKIQQKKFIEYLNNYIDALITQRKETVSKLDIAEVHVLMTLETILAQYKEIIGVKE